MSYHGNISGNIRTGPARIESHFADLKRGPKRARVAIQLKPAVDFVTLGNDFTNC